MITQKIILNYKQVELKGEKMDEISYVVVFPSIFSKNKIPQLIKNIKKAARSIEMSETPLARVKFTSNILNYVFTENV